MPFCCNWTICFPANKTARHSYLLYLLTAALIGYRGRHFMHSRQLASDHKKRLKNASNQLSSLAHSHTQNFLAANSQCWWNPSLIAATRSLKYVGHIAPGMLLVTAEPCALEILRNAYSRSVLKPPSTYSITFVGKLSLLWPIASSMHSWSVVDR